MDKIIDSIVDDLTLSYTAACRTVPTTVRVIATSLQTALNFASPDEVHFAFKRARDVADIPTQRVLRDALDNHRAEVGKYETPKAQGVRAIACEATRPLTEDERHYIVAWWQVHAGIRPSTLDRYGIRRQSMTDGQAWDIVGTFEKANPDFARRQNAHVREALTPRDELTRNINRRLHVDRFCAALGGAKYSQLCELTRHKREGDRPVLIDPVGLGDFLAQVEPHLLNVYARHGRRIALYARLPEGEPISLEMTPPSASEIRALLNLEQQTNNKE